MDFFFFFFCHLMRSIQLLANFKSKMQIWTHNWQNFWWNVVNKKGVILWEINKGCHLVTHTNFGQFFRYMQILTHFFDWYKFSKKKMKVWWKVVIIGVIRWEAVKNLLWIIKRGSLGEKTKKINGVEQVEKGVNVPMHPIHQS